MEVVEAGVEIVVALFGKDWVDTDWVEQTGEAPVVVGVVESQIADVFWRLFVVAP